jgi:hypothetical protein
MKLKDQFVPLTGFILILATAVVWSVVKARVSGAELAIIILASLLLYALLVSLWTWYHTNPKETLAENRRAYEELFRTIKSGYEEQYLKIKATVDKLIQKQRFIDQSILNVIESEAEEIWVVTTKLANELANEDLQRAVAKNLAEGKRYIYFLPDPNDRDFKKVDRNLEKFKQLDLYKNHRGQVEFIRLPPDTQFLLDEVVIYNPEKPETPHDPAHGINGFSYYEPTSDPDAEGPLHMKIEGHLLSFLSDRLSAIVTNSGLKAAVERILTELEDPLSDADKLYLVGLLRRHNIAKETYHTFIGGVAARTGEKNRAFISQLLGKYVEP